MKGIEQGVWIVNKTLTEVMAPKFDSPSARIQLLTTGLQESRFIYRVQVGGGPAYSFWQEEPNGVKAVLNHVVVGPILIDACNRLGVASDWETVYREVITNDELACVVARLILYADSNPLPKVGDSDGAFNYYIRNWRPGAYARGTQTQKDAILAKWYKNYAIAQEYVND
jgi:hypothetical protein